MTTWLDLICILTVFFSLSMLATLRIAGMIQIFSIQSFILGLMPFFMHADMVTGREAVIAIGTIVLKALLVPQILYWAIRHVSMRSEVRPIIGLGTSIMGGSILIAVAFWVSMALKLPGQASSDLVIPCSLSTVLLGFLIMVTRTRAVTQVLGYLVIENGIFLFATSLFSIMPTMIELGILLDIFVAVFIMAIVVNHINEEFERTTSLAVKSKMGEYF